MLADLAVNEPATFASIVATAKAALPAERQRAEARVAPHPVRSVSFGGRPFACPRRAPA